MKRWIVISTLGLMACEKAPKTDRSNAPEGIESLPEETPDDDSPSPLPRAEKMTKLAH